MIKFFRKIRQKLLAENKFRQYLIYAIGEIVLVVIGILIALQVNNYNNQQQEINKLFSYYEKLLEEVDVQIILTKKRIKSNEDLASMQRNVLDILASKDAVQIPKLLMNLGSIPTTWISNISTPMLNEFKGQDLLAKVENHSLKIILFELDKVLDGFRGSDSYIANQYGNLIEPYFTKNINYSRAALPKYKVGLVQGGPETNFDKLIKSLEFWNITTLKLETTNSLIKRSEKYLGLLVKLKLELKEEISIK